MERRIRRRKNEEWMNTFTDKSCSKFRKRERIGDKNKDTHKLRTSLWKENMAKEVNKKE